MANDKDPTYSSPAYRAAFDCERCGLDKTWCNCPEKPRTMMLNDELPEHAKIALEGARDDFLKSLRGRSETYDDIRAAATRFMKAVGAPEHVRPALEGLLVLQLKHFRERAMVDEQKAIDGAVRGERMRLRLALRDLLKE